MVLDRTRGQHKFYGNLPLQFTPSCKINISIQTTKGNWGALGTQERLLFDGHLNATNFKESDMYTLVDKIDWTYDQPTVYTGIDIADGKKQWQLEAKNSPYVWSGKAHAVDSLRV